MPGARVFKYDKPPGPNRQGATGNGRLRSTAVVASAKYLKAQKHAPKSIIPVRTRMAQGKDPAPELRSPRRESQMDNPSQEHNTCLLQRSPRPEVPATVST